MDWLKRMNDALAYMEDNLDSDISMEKAAQLACCSQYHFQRMFSYIIGVPLSEYLRRRRITKAAFDLQSGDKVIDVALRYGYDSPTAFNRAFQVIHGISPSAAQRADTQLKAFPPVSFQITIKGVTEMKYRIVEKESFRVVGIRIKDCGNVEENADGIVILSVDVSKEQGKAITSLSNGEPTGLICLSSGEGDDECYYLCSATDKPAPEGMHELNIPKHTWAVFPSVDEGMTVEKLLHKIYSEWQPTSAYEWAADVELEVYPNGKMDDSRYELWMPVVKKA